MVRGEGVYLAPGERVAIGATMEVGRDDLSPDASATQGLRAAAWALRPALDLDAAQVEVGVRVTTPDGLPLVGWSRSPGVILAVGARRNGWLLAPLVANMVAAYVTGDNPGPDAVAMDARRFEEPEVTIAVNLGSGDASARIWTCDLTHDYVTINGDYRT